MNTFEPQHTHHITADRNGIIFHMPKRGCCRIERRCELMSARCRTNSNLGNYCCCCWWPLRSCRVNVRCSFLCVGSWAKKSISREILHSFIVRIRWLSICLRLHNHNNKRWNVRSMLQREEKWWRAARLLWKIRNISEIPHTSALIVIPSTITFTLQPTRHHHTDHDHIPCARFCCRWLCSNRYRTTDVTPPRCTQSNCACVVYSYRGRVGGGDGFKSNNEIYLTFVWQWH